MDTTTQVPHQHDANGHTPMKRMSPRPFQDEAGEITNTHNFPHHHSREIEQVEITLDASTDSASFTPPQSPLLSSPSPSPSPSPTPIRRIPSSSSQSHQQSQSFSSQSHQQSQSFSSQSHQQSQSFSSDPIQRPSPQSPTHSTQSHSSHPSHSSHSQASTPTQSPSHHSPTPRRIADDPNRARSASSPSLTLGDQIQSAFTPVTQAFARLSSLASESPLINSLKSSNNSDSGNNPSFWKRKGKVPGSVKPAKLDTQKPHGFMARPPTPDDYNSSGHSSPHLPHAPLSPSASDPDIHHNQTNGFSNNNPPSDLHRSDGFDYEHHCLEFKSCGTRSEQATRLEKFNRILGENVVDLEALKKLCWTGIPGEVRAQCWKLLLGYLPANADRREVTLQRKRKEYFDCIPQYYDIPDDDRSEAELKIFRQIQIDVPRTNPNVALFQQPEVQKLLERILYIWAIRHPASGYVQGINDLATPFFVVFLSELVDSLGVSLGQLLENIDVCDVGSLPPEKIRLVEADSYWCMSKLLDGIQDHYTFAQPGIQRMIYKLKELVGRIDAPLAKHLGEQDAQFIQFAFRWMNCLLMREISLPLISRMWDTYLAEGATAGFSTFHVYVCAAFLVTWSEELRQREFQDIMLFLQHLPTTRWHCKDVELLLSQAFIWMSVFHNAPSHLK